MQQSVTSVIKDMEKRLKSIHFNLKEGSLRSKEHADEVIKKYEGIRGLKLPRNVYNEVKQYMLNKFSVSGNGKKKKITFEQAHSSFLAGVSNLEEAYSEPSDSSFLKSIYKEAMDDSDEYWDGIKEDSDDDSDDDSYMLEDESDDDSWEDTEVDKKETSVTYSDDGKDAWGESEEDDNDSGWDYGIKDDGADADSGIDDYGDPNDIYSPIKQRKPINPTYAQDWEDDALADDGVDSDDDDYGMSDESEEDMDLYGDESPVEPKDGDIEDIKADFSDEDQPNPAQFEDDNPEVTDIVPNQVVTVDGQKGLVVAVHDEKGLAKVSFPAMASEDGLDSGFDDASDSKVVIVPLDKLQVADPASGDDTFTEDEETKDTEEENGADSPIQPKDGDIEDVKKLEALKKKVRSLKESLNKLRFSKLPKKKIAEQKSQITSKINEAKKAYKAIKEGRFGHVVPGHEVGARVIYAGNKLGTVSRVEGNALVVKLDSGGIVKDGQTEFELIDQSPPAQKLGDKVSLALGANESIKGVITSINKKDKTAVVKVSEGVHFKAKLSLLEGIDQSEPPKGVQTDIDNQLVDSFEDEREEDQGAPDSRAPETKTSDTLDYIATALADLVKAKITEEFAQETGPEKPVEGDEKLEPTDADVAVKPVADIEGDSNIVTTGTAETVPVDGNIEAVKKDASSEDESNPSKFECKTCEDTEEDKDGEDDTKLDEADSEITSAVADSDGSDTLPDDIEPKKGEANPAQFEAFLKGMFSTLKILPSELLSHRLSNYSTKLEVKDLINFALKKHLLTKEGNSFKKGKKLV